MKRLLTRLLRPYRRQLAVVVALVLVQSIANLYLPTLNADIINDGVAKGDTHAIVSLGVVMLFVTLLMGVAAVIAVYWSARIAMGLGRDVRDALFAQVQSFSQMEVNRFGTASLITRSTNDVQQVQMLLMFSLTLMIAAPLMMIGGIFMALRMNARLSLLLVVILPVMTAFIAFIASRALPMFRAMQVKLDGINRILREKLSGIRVIRAFDRTAYEERRFEGANADLTATTLRVTRLFALMMPSVMLLVNLSTVAVMWFGSLQVGHGDMSIGNLTAFLTYLMQILFSILMASMMFVMLPRAAASADRIAEVLDVRTSIADPASPPPPPPPP
ncbi:MAG TPA: ABC transporter permease, partial [Actinomycetota bacterium]|nr:ABC transporter permease [Actinomycetota bacterium]